MERETGRVWPRELLGIAKGLGRIEGELWAILVVGRVARMAEGSWSRLQTASRGHSRELAAARQQLAGGQQPRRETSLVQRWSGKAVAAGEGSGDG